MADNSFDIKITTTGQPAGADSVAKSLQGVGKAADSASAANKKLDAAGKDAVNTVDALGKKGSAAKDVYEGLSGTLNGGVGAVFNLSKAFSNLGESIKANPIGTALAVTLAALGLVQKGFDYLGNAADRANDKLFGTGKATEEVRGQLDEMAKSSALAGTALKDAATTAATEWGALVKQMDAAQKRADALTNATMAEDIAKLDDQEAKAIADGRPEDRDGIKRVFDRKRSAVRSRYDQAGLDTSDSRSEVEIANARRTQTESRARLDAATAEADAKKQALQAAEEVALDASLSGSPASKAAAARQLFLAQRGSELAEGTLAAASAAERPVLASAQETIDAAEARKKENAIKRRTLGISRSAQTTTEQFVDSEATAKETAIAVAKEARRIAKLAPGAFEPERFVYDQSISGDRNTENRQGTSARNAARRDAIESATKIIEKTADKLGDGKDEESEIAALANAIQQLANATQTTSTKTIKDLTGRITTLENQLRYGNR
jgi:hypothetical protein